MAAVTPEDEFNKRIRTSQSIQPIGDHPFGENINLYNGAITFRQIDIEQAGIGLPIQLVRTFDPADTGKIDNWDARAFGDWRLELPSIQTITVPEEKFFTGNRCTEFNKAPQVTFSAKEHYNAVTFLPEHWWGGYQLEIPGIGRQDLLKRDPSNAIIPQMSGSTNGLMEFPIVTKANWVVACLPKISNETAGRGYNDKWGEGFLVVSPEGTKYWMDWLTYREYADVMPAAANSANVARQMAVMLATRVEDRFGNSLSYHYDESGNLLDIKSSDGRSLVLSYETWGGWHSSSISKSTYSRVISATLQASDAVSRTWKYSYSSAADYEGHLTDVTLPDGSSWNIGFSPFFKRRDNSNLSYLGYDECDPYFGQRSGSFDVAIRHPSGLLGTFSIGGLVRGRSYVPYDCGVHYRGISKKSLMTPNLYWGLNVVAKKISGPGVAEHIWKYSYSEPNHSWSKDCNAGCVTTVWTDTQQPDGSVNRYTFSNRFDYTESQLLQVDTYLGQAGSTLIRSENYTYSEPAAGPWPKLLGDLLVDNINSAQVSALSPISNKIISQDGAVYAYNVRSFDKLARPTAFTRASPWHSRSDGADYLDNLSKWVLGQVGKRTNDNTGMIESQTEYDATTALPIRTYAFGKLQQTLTYNPDGTLATAADGNNNITAFVNWKRGVPQSVRHADNTIVSASVNDYGLITAVTDGDGYTTTYEYDRMGRLASIAYPTNDSVAWNVTTQTFEQISQSEYGLPAGHWRQTIATGNARKVTYFDASWRPAITYEFDAGNPDLSRRYQRFSYDYAGRTTFSSYPGYTDVLSTGIWSNYDVLGRKTSVSQDSELGTLTTLTEYLLGNQTRVTDPRGNKTLTGYQVFNQPAYDAPVWIQHPEGATTEIARDVFGKPTSIRRRDASAGVSLTRSYVYDGYQQLCKTIEPETGASASGYDAAGNVVWTASGLSLPSTTACDADAAFASSRRVDRSYDTRNRITALTFPDGNGNQRWTYWSDGQVKQITTVNNGISTYNSFAYNKRRLLVGESQGQADGETWAIGYGYNANGHLAAHRYPSGQTIDYAPNALGQPTQAGSYATGVSYYPNGAIKQFTYGNGIVHTLTQNARQLPDTSQDAYGGTAFLSDGYDYDANGNVAAISDGATGRNQRGNRTMGYDGLDRLTSAVSPMFGTATYGYDVLDNLTHVVAPGRDHYYCYDGYWQLTNVKTGNCSGSTVIGMSYDVQGNLKNKNGQGFVFDYGNRLREATGKETYRYDGYGRRTLATQSAGAIGSMYDQAGALRYQKNQRQAKATDYIMLGGSLVAEADWPFGQTAAVEDYVNWTAVGGATRYVVEESVDGVTWTSVYEGADPSWTSLARPSGTYSYRVSVCMPDGTCSQATNVVHAQRPAFDIVPLLYQLLLS
jgi:YD repeat-containing protein